MPTTTDPLVKAALERLKRAADGRELSGYTGVNAGDVIAVCASLKKENETGVTAVLLKGAVGAGPNAEIHTKTEHLLHLLEKAG